jgi:hypothetical protein
LPASNSHCSSRRAPLLELALKAMALPAVLAVAMNIMRRRTVGELIAAAFAGVAPTLTSVIGAVGSQVTGL